MLIKKLIALILIPTIYIVGNIFLVSVAMILILDGYLFQIKHPSFIYGYFDIMFGQWIMILHGFVMYPLTVIIFQCIGDKYIKKNT